ncbi:MAG: hypothetical protein RIE31_04160 [Alphaproteobacteria bacterium]
MTEPPRLDRPPAETFPPTYDQATPADYFRVLGALDYAMPEHVANFVRRNAPAIAAARGVSRLRVLDFGCGYGAIGALIRHDLSMAALSRAFAGHDHRADGGSGPAVLPRRQDAPALHLGGLDVASRAVAFALRNGLIDAGFSDDLTAGAASGALADFLAETDLLIESGALMAPLFVCFERMIEAGRKPWLALAPRPDLHMAPLCAMLRKHGYGLEPLSRGRIFYRRLMISEHEPITARSAALGRDMDDAFDGDRMFVRPCLARPLARQGGLAVGDLVLMDED